MRLTFSELAQAEAPQAEICVIGSGPAGMTVALQLAKHGRRVLMLEAGDEYWTDESQEVYRGETVGDPYFDLDTARLRHLGGSSGHWGGWCRTLDAMDFEPKPNFAHAHWPIRKSDLEPYLPGASDILGIPIQPESQLIDADIGIERTEFTFSNVQFASKFRHDIDSSENLTWVSGANVTLINTDGQRITGLTVQDYDNNQIMVEAGQYVLATGGIENSRLLLWSNEVQNGALAPDHMPLGGYWMEHPTFEIGEAIIRGDLPDMNFFHLSQEKQRELGILNCGLRLFNRDVTPAGGLLGNLACYAPAASNAILSLANVELLCGTQLGASWEQEPVIDNRVVLSTTERDKFGIPRSELHWKKTRRDLETVRKSGVVLGQFLAEHNLGRVRLNDWVFGYGDFPTHGELAGYHHMGGTRMSDSPYDGVVDENCRMFGQDNLYIAGSSVFATGGYSNPTVTIVQLALRLADHLAA